MQKIYRRTPPPKCDFNKVEKHIFWTSFPKNTYGGLFLFLHNTETKIRKLNVLKYEISEYD